jgi:hypothetical protein
MVYGLINSAQVYGRRLTALVLDAAHQQRDAISLDTREGHGPRDDGDDEDDNDEDDDYDGVNSNPGTIPFGDSGQARLFSVKCHKRKEQEHSGRSSA